MPAFGEEVGIWRSQDKKLIKSANNRGAIGRLIEVTPWQNGTTLLIAKGSDLQNPEIIHGLQPKTVAGDCLRLAEPRTIPEGWTKPALDAFAKQWNSIRTPEGKDLWIQLTTGNIPHHLSRSLPKPSLRIPLRIGVMLLRGATTTFVKKCLILCVLHNSQSNFDPH